MSPKDRDTSKPKKGSKPKKKRTEDDSQEDNLMDLMEIYDSDESELEPPTELEPEKVKRHPDKPKSKKKKDIEPGKPKKVEPEKKEKKKERVHIESEKTLKTKHKPKGKRKPEKPKKRSTRARKVALSGKARKLPIDEADESVDIDWSFEGDTGDDQVLTDFERERIEREMKYYEREKINLMNEVVFLRTDLEQKTTLVDDLKKENEILRKDFDNYKKRIRGEIKDNLKFASEKLILELLEVMDNFDRTYDLDIKTADKEDVVKGFQIIHNQLLEVLKKEGVVPIKAKGEPFDPYIHEALSTVKTDEHPHNTVFEELQKGYEYKQKVLRPSKVRVTQSDIVPPIPVKPRVKKKEKPKAEMKKKTGKKLKKEVMKEPKKGVKMVPRKEEKEIPKKKDLVKKLIKSEISEKKKKKKFHREENRHKKMKKKHGF